VRKYRADQFGLGRLQGLGDRVTLDQLGNLGADHVRTEKLAGLAVEHRLDHAFGLAECNRLTVAGKREVTDLDLVTGLSRCLLGQAHARDLWPAIGAGGDVVPIERVHVVDPGDPLDADDTFVHRLVRQPRRADEVADRVDAGLAGAKPFIDDDVAPFDLDTGVFEPDAFDVADNADGEDDALDSELAPLPPPSMRATTFSPLRSSAATVAPVWILIPCFSKDLRAKAEISSSSTGSTRSSTSTTVTSAPMSW